MKTALTIAGSDSSGGAGIQADIKTMTAHGIYASSAVTLLTAQNTLGVTGIECTSPQFLKMQIDAVFSDIYPDAVKIGAIGNAELAEAIAERLAFYHAKNIVLDPVMVATSGSKLISDDAIETVKEKLIPLACVITPNIPEAEELSGMTITNEAEMVKAAKMLGGQYHCAVLIKGGHHINDANDFLFAPATDEAPEKAMWFKGKRVDTKNTHGTGCTLSSAIASNLAKGYSLENAIAQAKGYLSGALADGLDLGAGAGPMNHLFALHSKYFALPNAQAAQNEGKQSGTKTANNPGEGELPKTLFQHTSRSTGHKNPYI